MNFFNKMNQYMKLRRLFLAAACVVVFGVTYSLILPAITMERKTYCGMEEHEHTEDCYTVTRTCVCGQEESEGHEHTDQCYEENEILVCEQEENEDHTHTEECYETEKILVCGKQETAGHTHDDSCYEEEKELTCGMEEHVHTDECFVDPDAEETQETEETENNTEEDSASEENSGNSGESNAAPDSNSMTNETDGNDKEDISGDDSSDESGETLTKTTEDSTDEETQSETETDEIPESMESDPELSYPKMVLKEAIRENLFKNWIEIEVHVPEGSLPEGSSLLLEQYEPKKKYRDEYDNELNHALFGGLLEDKALKLSFVDAAGMPVIPMTEVKVFVRDSMIKDAENIELVLVDDEKKTDLKTFTIALDEKENAKTDEDVVTFNLYPADPAVLVAASTTLEKTLTAEGSDYAVTVNCSAKAGIPKGSSLKVKEIRKNASDYQGYVSDAEKALGVGEGEVSYARFFDITIMDSKGNEIQPREPVDVKIVLNDLKKKAQDNENAQVVHFGDEGEEVTAEQNGDAVSFEAEGFSVYGVVRTALEKTVLTKDGHNYKITVNYREDAGIPENADLFVEEITENSTDYRISYDDYVSMAEDALGWEAGTASYIRMFNIKIVDKNDPEIKYQPTEGTTVDVKIELADKDSEEAAQVVHIEDGANEGNVVGDAAVDGKTVAFAAEGFSIYVIAENGYYARLIYQFHDVDGTVISTQYIKKYVDSDENNETEYETFYDPGLIPEYGQRFIGWAYSANETDASKIYQLADLDIHAAQKLDAADFEDELTVDVYPIMDEAWYLRYMDVDENGNVKILKTERISKTAADKHVDINHMVELPEGVHYEGWYDPVLNETYSEHLYEGDHENFDTIPELNRHLDLYLKLDNRVWLVFDANAGGPGSGATYTPPQMLYTNAEPPQTTEKPEDPVWKGYTFTGWNTKPDGSGEDWLVVSGRTFDAYGNLVSTDYSTNKFGETLKEDVILYAQWTPDDNFYRIAYWRQKETDSIDAADSDKKYDFYGYREISDGIKTGDEVSATANDQNYTWVVGQLHKTNGDENKFSFNAANSDTETKRVAGDGSTVLNMYFDRAVMTFIFNQSFNWYTETEDLSGTIYGYVDGEYVELEKGEMVTTYSYTMQYVYTATNDNDDNRYGLINGEYVRLTRGNNYNSVDGGATVYNGQRYNPATNNNGTQFGIVDNEVVQLTRVDGGCTGNDHWEYNGQLYEGDRYVQANNGRFGFDANSHEMKQISQYRRYTYNNNPYTGTRYSIANSNTAYTGTRYSGINGTPVTGHTGQQYGIDDNGGYVPLNRSSETNYSSFTYEDSEGNPQEYSGTFYERGTTNQLQGLYGSQMKTGEWPSGTWQFANNGANSYNSYSNRTTLNAPWTSYKIANSAYEYSHGTSPYTTWHLYNASLSTGVNVVYWRQDPDGNYTNAIRTTGGDGVTLNIANNKFYGFTVLGYEYGGIGGTPDSSNNTGNYGWHDLKNLGTGTTSLTMHANHGDINIYYQRDKFNVTFQSNDASSHVKDYIEPVFYEKNLGFLKDFYTPAESDGKDGYFFAGWYSDANFTKPFDFENETMPHNDIVLYGKWDTYRVRIVLVPTVNNAHNDEVSFPNNQSLTFRLNYNEKISDANINSTVAERTGYKLVGWYTTPDFQDGTEWNFSTQVNSRVPAVNMDYQESEDWTNNTYNDNDGSHDDVEGIMKLYAKWQFDFNEDDLFIEYEVPESYVKRDALGNLLTVIPQDSTKYTYDPNSTSLQAVIKDAPENYLDAFTFEKWEVMDSANIPTGKYLNPNDTAFIEEALPIIQTRQMTDDNGETRTMNVVVLRAVFTKNNNNKGTVVTFDGNGGTTVDNDSETRTLTLLVNEDFQIPAETGENAFHREGYSLVGWSFHSDTTIEEFQAAVAEADSADNPAQELAKMGMFNPTTQVAADNLKLSDDNNWDPLSNTIYAIWDPHKFPVSVKKIVDGEIVEDKVFSFNTEGLQEEYSTFELVNNQTETIPDVPYGTTFTITETPYPGYTVKSVTAKQISDANGDPLDEEEYIDLEGQDGKTYEVHGAIEIVYTNELSAVPVILKKMGYVNTDPNAQEFELEGAAFTIYTTETGNEVAKDTEGTSLSNLTSGQDGVFFNGRLNPGNYYLYESHVPAGFYAPLGRYKLEISNDTVSLSPTWITGYPDPTEDAVTSATDAETGVKIYTVKVRNTAGVELPSTGGMGTAIFYAAGCLLVVLAGFVLLRRKRVL